MASQLTKRERYLRALKCEQPDRVPIVVRGVNPMFGTAGLPPSRDPSFQPLIEAVAEKTEWAYRWHPAEEDLLSRHIRAVVLKKIRPSNQAGFDEHVRIFETPLGALETVEWVSREGKPGMTRKYLIETLEDVEKFLSIPYRFQKPDADSFFRMEQQMGENGVLMASIGLDPIGHVTHWLGLETLAVWSVMHRDVILRLLDEFCRRAELLIKAMIADGIGPVFATLGMEQATPPWLSALDFAEFAKIYDQRLWAPIQESGGLVHVHCHGNLKDVLADLIGMGAGCLHPVEAPPMGDIELADAKEKMGSNISIEGNVQLDDFYTQNEEFMRETVHRAIAAAADCGGFILCPTASPIPPTLDGTVLNNYLAFIEAGLEYGKYA